MMAMQLQAIQTKTDLIAKVKEICVKILSDPFEIIEHGSDLAIKTDDGIMYLTHGDCFIEHKDEFILLPRRVKDLANLYEDQNYEDWEEN